MIVPKWMALGFAHFCCNYLISGYHDCLILTNLAVLTWQYCLVAGFLYFEPDSTLRAGRLFLAALGNFYAAATTRFNDSGFTSGLSMFLPPFLCFNQLLILALGFPTMVLAGVVCGRAIFLSGLYTAILCGSLAVIVGWFFRDVHAWMPSLGYMGGAGTSEGFDASYLRAGLYPATFAAPQLFDQTLLTSGTLGALKPLQTPGIEGLWPSWKTLLKMFWLLEAMFVQSTCDS